MTAEALVQVLPPWSLNFGIWLCVSALIALYVARRFSWLAGACAAWFAWSALRVFAAPASPFDAGSDVVLSLMRPGDSLQAFSQIVEALTDSNAAASLAQLALFLLAAWALSVRSWIYAFQGLAIINGLLDLWLFSQGVVPFGLLMQASMSGCFAAACLPLFFTEEEPSPLLILIAALPVALSMQSLPLGCFFILCWFALLLKGEHALRFPLLAGLPVVAFGIGYAVCGRSFLDSSGRFQMWPHFLSWWSDNASAWQGTGSGSFLTLGPRIGKLFSRDMGYFSFMHNDWLQILFEQGLVGLALIALFYVELLYRSVRRLPLLLSWLVYGCFAAANMPLRYPLSALLGAFLLRWTFEPGECTE